MSSRPQWSGSSFGNQMRSPVCVFSTALLFSCSTALIFGPLARKLEAGGIEPPSRDNSNGGLYMHSRWFDLDISGGHRQPPPASSRLCLIRGSTAESTNQPTDCGRRVVGYASCRGHLIIRRPYEPERQSRPGLQHRCWQLMFCSMIYEANERPRHATATVAIRSKPVAPGGPTYHSYALNLPQFLLRHKC